MREFPEILLMWIPGHAGCSSSGWWSREGLRQLEPANANPVGASGAKSAGRLQQLCWPLVSSVAKLLECPIGQPSGFYNRVRGDGSYRTPQHLQGLLWSSAAKAAGSSAEADPGIHGLSCHVAGTGSPYSSSWSLSASRCLSWSAEGVKLCAAPQKVEEAGCSPYSLIPVMGISMLVPEQGLLGGWDDVAQRNSTSFPFCAIFDNCFCSTVLLKLLR